MGREKKLLGLTFGLVALLCSAGLALALPTGSLTVVPAGGTSGGGGVAIPSYNTTAVTKATVNDNAQPPQTPGVAKIYYRNTDEASAWDKATMTCEVGAPDPGKVVLCKVVFSGSGTSEVVTENAPGNPDQGTYSATAGGDVWANLQRENTDFPDYQGGGDTMRAHLHNDEVGPALDPCSFTFGTLANPKSVGATGVALKATFKYGVSAYVNLSAQRPEVGVGGQASAGQPSGSIAAWHKAYNDDGTYTEELLKRADDPTQDALWLIQ
jgi:hypothetical protein